MRHKRAESLIIQVAGWLFGRRNADTIARNRRRDMKILLPFILATLCTAKKKPPIQLDARMPRQQQIELAESAAPKSVSTKATIYVLSKNGYEKARAGS